MVCAAIHEVQQSWIFSFLVTMLSGYNDYGGRIIWGIVIVDVSVHPCLPVAESSHKISGALFQQHFVVY